MLLSDSSTQHTDASICKAHNLARSCNSVLYVPLSDFVVKSPKNILPDTSAADAEAIILPYVEHIYISRRRIADALAALDPFFELIPSEDPLGLGNALPLALIHYLPPPAAASSTMLAEAARYLECTIGYVRPQDCPLNFGLRDLAWERDYAHELPLPLNLASRGAFAEFATSVEFIKSDRLYCLVIAYLQRFTSNDVSNVLGTTGWWDAWEEELQFQVTKTEDALAQMLLIVAFSGADKWRKMVRVGYRKMYERCIACDASFWPRVRRAYGRARTETCSEFLAWVDQELEMMMLAMTVERRSKLPPVFSAAPDFLESELNRQETLLADLAKMTFVAQN
jgi:hypothetical protein